MQQVRVLIQMHSSGIVWVNHMPCIVSTRGTAAARTHLNPPIYGDRIQMRLRCDSGALAEFENALPD